MDYNILAIFLPFGIIKNVLGSFQSPNSNILSMATFLYMPIIKSYESKLNPLSFIEGNSVTVVRMSGNQLRCLKTSFLLDLIKKCHPYNPFVISKEIEFFIL